MASGQVPCPSCGHEFAVEEAMSARLNQQFAKQLEQERAKVAELMRVQQAAIEKEREKAREREQALDLEFRKKIKAENEKLRELLQRELQEEHALKEREKAKEVENLRAKLRESEMQELAIRRRATEIEEREKRLELETQRKLDEERSKIREEVAKLASEENRLQLAQREKVIDDMRKQIEDLKRKSEQGSQQLQGEVFELELEKELSALFPDDIWTPIKSGARGGDLLQTVLLPSRKEAGKILWEIKQTKEWQPKWIEKLKEDQRECGASAAVIVTQALPKGVDTMELIDGVWVISKCALAGIATALRMHLSAVGKAMATASSGVDTQSQVFKYVTSLHFKQRIEAVVDVYTSLTKQLEKEKKALLKNLQERAAQNEKLIENIAGLWGDLTGYAGSSLPSIASLEFDDEADSASSTQLSLDQA